MHAVVGLLRSGSIHLNGSLLAGVARLRHISPGIGGLKQTVKRQYKATGGIIPTEACVHPQASAAKVVTFGVR